MDHPALSREEESTPCHIPPSELAVSFRFRTHTDPISHRLCMYVCMYALYVRIFMLRWMCLPFSVSFYSLQSVCLCVLLQDIDE